MEPITADPRRIKSVSKANVYRREVEWALADLGEPELRVARDFLAFLRSRASDPETLEILQSPALMRDIRAARAELRDGKTSRFVAWKTLKAHI